MTRNASCACLAAWLTFVAAAAFAQPPAPLPDTSSAEPPAHIAVVDGRATLERAGRPESSPLSMPLLSGDRLRTEDGRVEVLFADGAALHLDTSSTVDFQSDELLRLLDGRVRLIIPGPRRELSYRIDTPGGWVQIAEPGEYRVAVTGLDRGSQVELVVLRGAAQLMNADGQTALRAGERAVARAGEAPSYAYVYNSAAWDSFDRWSESRRSDSAGASAQYLPDTVQAYSATFDQYGSWRTDPTYGQVWYPVVSVGWRPYFHGRWASYPGYGWTWIGADPWAWPTHHYGRWGFAAGSWFWIPGRTWAPAWVSWAYAPGYTSWCPLGWDNRPVWRFGHPYYGGGHYDHWTGWTVVASGHFGAGRVHTSFVRGAAIDARTRGAFVVRSGAPQVHGGYAVARNVAPIRVAGSRPAGTYAYAGATGRAATPGRGETRPALAALGSARTAERRGVADGAGARASLSAGGRGSATAGSGAPAAAAGTDARTLRAGPEVIRGGVRDETAAFRDSRSQTEASGGTRLPAPSRAPRTSPEVIQRMAAPRAQTAAPRTFDPASVPVYRGTVPRTSDQPADARAALSTRTPVAGVPAGAQPAARSWSNDDRRMAPAPGYQRPDALSGGGQMNRTPAPYGAVPRAPQLPPAPSYRPYGGEERRAAPGPPPGAPAGAGGGAPRSPTASDPGPSRGGPQGQPAGGAAARRGGGRG